MAQKRMFSREITDSDAFLDLSLAAQCLYFHVCLAADDEGFISAGKRIARTIGATESDLQELVDSGFLIMFPDSGIYVAAHFWVNNTLKSDRFHPTVHQAERKQLELTENKVYIIRKQAGTAAEPIRDQSGIECSIVKNKKEKNSTDDISSGEGSPEGGDESPILLLRAMAQKDGIRIDVENALSRYGFNAAHEAFTRWKNSGAVIGKYKDFLPAG